MYIYAYNRLIFMLVETFFNEINSSVSARQKKLYQQEVKQLKFQSTMSNRIWLFYDYIQLRFRLFFFFNLKILFGEQLNRRKKRNFVFVFLPIKKKKKNMVEKNGNK